MKKYIINSFIALFALSFVGCNSLDIKPDSVITDANYWKTAAHFKAFNVAMHSQMRAGSYSYFILGEGRCNYYIDLPFGGEATQGIEVIPMNTLNKDNPGVSNFASLYGTINQLSLMIDKTEVTSLLTDAEKGYYLGTAYGMRAYLYFHLLRSWGDVVLHIHGTDGADIDIFNLQKAASPADEVMAQIKSDISASESGFGQDYGFGTGRHYWSLAATKMLKGEVYLWSGRQMGGGNGDYQTAKQALLDVSNADVELLPNFEDIFAFNNKNNKEIIFAFRSKQDEYNLWGGSYASTMLPQGTYLLDLYDENGVQYKEYEAKDLLSGGIRRQINLDIFEKFYDDNDKRKRGTLKGVYEYDENGDFVFVAPFAYKYRGTLVEGGTSPSLLNDNPIYRYADCILLLATAKAFLNEDITAEINQIRRRGFGADYFDANIATLGYPNDLYNTDTNTYKYVGSDVDPLEAILKERAREFMFEGKRWYDLRLMGWSYVNKYSLAQQDRLLWPINESALTNNPALVQTPGY